VLGKSAEGKDAEEKVNALYALTSFEFYSSIMEVNDDHGEAARLIRSIVEKSLLYRFSSRRIQNRNGLLRSRGRPFYG
jgi:hypothetical protein